MDFVRGLVSSILLYFITDTDARNSRIFIIHRHRTHNSATIMIYSYDGMGPEQKV